MGVHWLIQSLWCFMTWGKFFKTEIRWPLMLERGKTTASRHSLTNIQKSQKDLLSSLLSSSHLQSEGREF